jgi:hypothetical protein
MNESYGYDTPFNNSKHVCDASWVTGTFILPSGDNTPILPKQLLVHLNTDIIQNDDVQFKHFTLEDSTVIPKRSRSDDPIKKKRKHGETADKNKK